MKAYISIAFRQRQTFADEINSIASALEECKIEPFVFVDHYRFDITDERKMMMQAMKDIDGCDLLIAETSEKAIGIGVEAGYAKGKDKPVIYLRQKNSEHSTTVSGISDVQVIYEDAEDLKRQLREVLLKIVRPKQA